MPRKPKAQPATPKTPRKPRAIKAAPVIEAADVEPDDTGTGSPVFAPLVVNFADVTDIADWEFAPEGETAETFTSNIVTNCIKGTTLSLADGRSIKHGESAEVHPEEAKFLRERGQVE